MFDRIYFLLRISTTLKEMMEDDDATGHFSIAYRVTETFFLFPSS